MSGDAGDWVREGTPRDADATWADEQTDYGTAVSPEEWDDYSVEQSVPVAPPQSQPEAAETAPEVAADDHRAEGTSERVDPGHENEVTAAEGVETVDLGDEADARWEHRDAPAQAEVADDGADVPLAVDESAGQPVAADAAEPESVGVREQSEEYAAEPTADLDAPEEPVSPVAEDAAVDAPENVGTADLPSADEPAESWHADGEAHEGAVVADDATAESPAAEPVATHADPVVTESTAVSETDTAEAMADDSRTAAADDDAHFRAPTGDHPEVAEPTTVVDDDLDATQRHNALADDDLDATQVRPVVAPGAGAVAGAAAAGVAGASAAGAGAASPALPDGLYRHSADDDTAILAAPAAAGYPDVDEQEAEERRLRDQLAAERQARNQRLGVVDTSAENEVRDREGFVKLNTDRFFPSLGLFVLRLVTAGILGIAGYRILMAIPATAEKFQPTLIPEPRLVAWILGFTLGALALLLVIGMLQRLVGLVLLAISAASLALLRWGNFNVFSASWEGFPLIGDKELLLGAIGFLLLSMGGGSWGIDGAFRRSRANARAEKSA